jgi:CBS domain containing-hemolysin-like protein
MRVALVLALVVVNAAFAGSEMALVSLREGQLGRLERASRSGCSAGPPTWSCGWPAENAIRQMRQQRQQFALVVDSDGSTTVAGLVLARLGHIPTEPGEVVTTPGFTGEVVEIAGRAITGSGSAAPVPSPATASSPGRDRALLPCRPGTFSPVR